MEKEKNKVAEKKSGKENNQAKTPTVRMRKRIPTPIRLLIIASWGVIVACLVFYLLNEVGY